MEQLAQSGDLQRDVNHEIDPQPAARRPAWFTAEEMTFDAICAHSATEAAPLHLTGGRACFRIELPTKEADVRTPRGGETLR